MARLVPMLFERRLLPKPWGGRALERTPGLRLPAGAAIGETWELYDRPDGSSPIRGSTRTLADVLADDPVALLGAGVARGFGGRFPLLVKYIDAADRLSVQVHPGVEQARAAGDGAKTEAWVVLATGPAARIVCGLADGVTAEAFAAVAASAEVEPLLHAFRPEVGEAIFVPHGTVHAIGPDVVVLEIQQNSDVTYRLYDWGRPRDTHLAEGLRALRVDAPCARRALPDDDGWLIRADAFGIRRVAIGAPVALATDGVFAIANVVAGAPTLAWDDGAVDLAPGDTVLVPACVPRVTLRSAAPATVYWTVPGRSPA